MLEIESIYNLAPRNPANPCVLILKPKDEEKAFLIEIATIESVVIGLFYQPFSDQVIASVLLNIEEKFGSIDRMILEKDPRRGYYGVLEKEEKDGTIQRKLTSLTLIAALSLLTGSPVFFPETLKDDLQAIPDVLKAAITESEKKSKSRNDMDAESLRKRIEKLDLRHFGDLGAQEFSSEDNE